MQQTWGYRPEDKALVDELAQIGIFASQDFDISSAQIYGSFAENCGDLRRLTFYYANSEICGD